MVVEVFAEFGLTVSEKKTKTLVMKLPSKRAKEENRRHPNHHRWASRQRDNGTPRRLSSDTWAGSSIRRRAYTGDLTTGAGQRGDA